MLTTSNFRGIMARIHCALLIAAVSVFCVAAQSGRRITTSPVSTTPSARPTAKVDVPDDYSESRPAEKRPIYRKPVKDHSAKKSEKSEPEAVPTVMSDDESEVLKVDT